MENLEPRPLKKAHRTIVSGEPFSLHHFYPKEERKRHIIRKTTIVPQAEIKLAYSYNELSKKNVNQEPVIKRPAEKNYKYSKEEILEYIKTKRQKLKQADQEPQIQKTNYIHHHTSMPSEKRKEIQEYMIKKSSLDMEKARYEKIKEKQRLEEIQEKLKQLEDYRRQQRYKIESMRKLKDIESIPRKPWRSVLDDSPLENKEFNYENLERPIVPNYKSNIFKDLKENKEAKNLTLNTSILPNDEERKNRVKELVSIADSLQKRIHDIIAQKVDEKEESKQGPLTFENENIKSQQVEQILDVILPKKDIKESKESQTSMDILYETENIEKEPENSDLDKQITSQSKESQTADMVNMISKSSQISRVPSLTSEANILNEENVLKRKLPLPESLNFKSTERLPYVEYYGNDELSVINLYRKKWNSANSLGTESENASNNNSRVLFGNFKPEMEEIMPKENLDKEVQVAQEKEVNDKSVQVETSIPLNLEQKKKVKSESKEIQTFDNGDLINKSTQVSRAPSLVFETHSTQTFVNTISKEIQADIVETINKSTQISRASSLTFDKNDFQDDIITRKIHLPKVTQNIRPYDENEKELEFIRSLEEIFRRLDRNEKHDRLKDVDNRPTLLTSKTVQLETKEIQTIEPAELINRSTQISRAPSLVFESKIPQAPIRVETKEDHLFDQLPDQPPSPSDQNKEKIPLPEIDNTIKVEQNTPEPQKEEELSEKSKEEALSMQEPQESSLSFTEVEEVKAESIENSQRITSEIVEESVVEEKDSNESSLKSVTEVLEVQIESLNDSIKTTSEIPEEIETQKESKESSIRSIIEIPEALDVHSDNLDDSFRSISEIPEVLDVKSESIEESIKSEIPEELEESVKSISEIPEEIKDKVESEKSSIKSTLEINEESEKLDDIENKETKDEEIENDQSANQSFEEFPETLEEDSTVIKIKKYEKMHKEIKELDTSFTEQSEEETEILENVDEPEKDKEILNELFSDIPDEVEENALPEVIEKEILKEPVTAESEKGNQIIVEKSSLASLEKLFPEIPEPTDDENEKMSQVEKNEKLSQELADLIFNDLLDASLSQLEKSKQLKPQISVHLTSLVNVFDRVHLNHGLDILLNLKDFSNGEFIFENEHFDLFIHKLKTEHYAMNISEDQMIVFRLLFDAVNEYLSTIEKQKSRMMCREELIEKIMDKIMNQWLDYAEREGENLDLFLADELKEEENDWLNLDTQQEMIKEQLTEMIWDSILTDTVNSLLVY